jgi:hypothetical protein
MNKIIPCLLLAICCGYSSGSSAELLGRISDETAVPEQPSSQVTQNHNPKVTYRVICPEGETSPECGQSPIEDNLDLRPGSKVSKKPKPHNQK